MQSRLTIPEATGPLTELGFADHGEAVATDLVDPNPYITTSSTGWFPLGQTLIGWATSDSSGNIYHEFQLITIRDTTPPAITPPSDYTAETTDMLTPLSERDYGTAVAVDPADPNVEITSNATATFPLGTTVVMWTATDSSGNTATAMQ